MGDWSHSFHVIPHKPDAGVAPCPSLRAFLHPPPPLPRPAQPRGISEAKRMASKEWLVQISMPHEGDSFSGACCHHKSTSKFRVRFIGMDQKAIHSVGSTHEMPTHQQTCLQSFTPSLGSLPINFITAPKISILRCRCISKGVPSNNLICAPFYKDLAFGLACDEVGQVMCVRETEAQQSSPRDYAFASIRGSSFKGKVVFLPNTGHHGRAEFDLMP
jgi:hypothetical protein